MRTQRTWPRLARLPALGSQRRGSLGVMATDKRERQRANREEKKAAEAKTKRRKEIFAVVKKWTIYGVLLVVALLVVTFLFR